LNGAERIVDGDRPGIFYREQLGACGGTDRDVEEVVVGRES